jgi:hypothetical protein
VRRGGGGEGEGMRERERENRCRNNILLLVNVVISKQTAPQSN